MNYLNTFLILLVAYIAIFLEAYSNTLRNWLGTQIDLIPALMVYCGLSSSLGTLALTAVFAGLWFDALSTNPLGITVLPQFVVGFAAHQTRDLVLRDQPYARFVLGMAGGAAAPFLTVLLLWGGGYKPIIGWGSLWQWGILSLGSGVLTPGCFWFFDRLNATLTYGRPSESTFRPDREIKRGRN